MDNVLELDLPQAGCVNRQQLSLSTSGAVAVLGKSGEGKSTLLKILGGLFGKQKHGRYQMFGYTWTHHSADNPCVYVNQTYGLFTSWTVEQNLGNTFKHSNSSYKQNVPKITVKQVVEDLKLHSLLKKPVLTLSGGETQRVLIARAMLTNKPIILLDEVFNSLDTNMKNFLLHKLVYWQKHYKRHFLIVSHQLSDSAFLCQQALIVKEGNIQAYSSFLTALGEYEANPEAYVNNINVEYLKTIEEEAVYVYKLKGSDQLIYRKANPKELLSEQSFERLQVAASQVSVCLDQNISISTLNKLNGVVVDIEYKENGVYIFMDVDGQIIQAHISQRSQKQINIRSGQMITAVFKAV